MTINFLIDYIPRFMKIQGYDEQQYRTEWLEINIPPSETVSYQGGNGYFFLSIENANTSPDVIVTSRNGKINFQDGDSAFSYMHQGKIKLENTNVSTTRRIALIAAFPIIQV